MLLYTRRLSVIAGFIGLSVITLFLFISSQTERASRIKKDRELQQALVTLSGKDAEIAEIQKQRAEAEKALNEKITQLESSVSTLGSQNASLQASLNAQEENLKVLTQKNDSLLKDKEALMEDNLDKSEDVTNLEKKIAYLQA